MSPGCQLSGPTTFPAPVSMFPSIGRIVPEVSGPNFLENVRNSPDISKGIFKARLCKFESSQVSHPAFADASARRAAMKR
jgi:hypothetical protein